jgi:hypothetical protein
MWYVNQRSGLRARDTQKCGEQTSLWCGCATEYLPALVGEGCGASCRSGIRRDGAPAAPVRAARAWLTVMAIDRLPGLRRVVMSEVDGTDALYEIALTAAPSPAWRAVFLPPPTRGYWPGRFRRRHGPFPCRPTATRHVAPANRPLDRLRELGGGGVTPNDSNSVPDEVQ